MIDDLSDAISQIIIDNRTTSRIFPTWVANEAMQKLDPERVAPPAVYHGCMMYARQVARERLRKTFEADVVDSDEQRLPFTDAEYPELQARYPTKRGKDGEEQYVLLADMTADDVAYNVTRLRLEAQSKEKHADALEAWGRKHVKKGAA